MASVTYRFESKEIVLIILICLSTITNLNSFVFYQIDTPSIPSVIQTSYSSALTKNNPMHLLRDICTSLIFYYEAIELKVVQSGTYSFVVNGISFSCVEIYIDKFNPFNPYENPRSYVIGSWFSINLKLVADIQANTTYVLVVSTFSPSVRTDFSVIVYGPKNVTLNHLSEYFCCFVNNLNKIWKFLVTSTATHNS